MADLSEKMSGVTLQASEEVQVEQEPVEDAFALLEKVSWPLVV